MNNALMFSKASDEWSTPQEFFDRLNEEFEFVFDAAATKENRKVGDYFGLDHPYPEQRDALAIDWLKFGATFWLNPPYSKCREFIAKAAQEAQRGATVVCLVPSRTDTRWWHEHVWSAEFHQPRRYVEVRFVKGRLKFGGGKDCAPFPSVVIVFRPHQRGRDAMTLDEFLVKLRKTPGPWKRNGVGQIRCGEMCPITAVDNHQLPDYKLREAANRLRLSHVLKEDIATAADRPHALLTRAHRRLRTQLLAATVNR